MYQTESGSGGYSDRAGRAPFNVQDYKEKRAAQLERARRIREERDARKAVHSGGEAPAVPRPAPALPRAPAPPSFDDAPIRGAPPPSQAPPRPPAAPAARRRSAFEEPTPEGRASVESSSSSHSYGYDSAGGAARPRDGPTAAPRGGRADPPAAPRPGPVLDAAAPRVPVGEVDISGAVAAGILDPAQADQLWHYLAREPRQPSRPTGNGRLPPAPEPEPPAAYRGASSREPARSSRVSDDGYDGHRGAPSREPARSSRVSDDGYEPPRGSGRGGKSDWNFDTEVAYDDLGPEPAPPQSGQRRAAGRAAPRGSSKPDWNGDFTGPAPDNFDDQPIRGAAPKPRGSTSGGKVVAFQNEVEPAMGAPAASDKLALLKARSSARATTAPEKPSYAPGIVYENSPFGTTAAATAPRASARPRGGSGPSGYHSPSEDDYQTGRIIESEEEQQIKQHRSAELEVDMYEASNVPMRPCHICGRSFRQDRIAKHSAACEKAARPRKAFDIAQHRQEGEAIVAAKAAQRQPSKAQRKPQAAPKPGALPKWKQQHLEFQNALKAGRTGPGGDVLPPVPVQDTRTECPHCGRRFADDVAERHIPKCQTINRSRGTFRR